MSEATLDLSAFYKVDGYSGIAWYCVGYATTWTEEEWVYDGAGDPEDESSYLYNEPEELEDTSRVRMVMVGDDTVFTFYVEDINPLSEDAFCHECGQIGCHADGL